MNNSKISAFFAYLLAASFLHSSIEIENIQQLYYQDLQEDQKHLSPLMGLLALKSGLLEDIRYNGNYGSENEKFLCHYSLLPDQRNIDCPQDYTTAIIQQIFPSPAHGELVTTNAISDFFYKLTIEQIGTLLKKYSEAKQDINSSENLSMFFEKIFRAKDKSRVFANWKAMFPNSTYSAALVPKYTAMFLGAINEQNSYPPNLVEAALLALAIKKAKEPKELKKLVQQFVNEPKDNNLIYNEMDYIEFEKNYLLGNKITPSNLHRIGQSPIEDFTFYILGYDKYRSSPRYPPKIGEIDNLPGDQGQPFTACVENALLNFLNIVTAASDTKSFEVLHLKTPLEELKKYYSYQTNFNCLLETYEKKKKLELKTLWSKLVSNHEIITYLKHEQNTFKGGYEASTEISNTVGLLGILLSDSKLVNFGRNSQNNKDALNYLFSKLSRGDFKLSWQVKNGNYNDLNKDYSTIIILVNNKETFEWNFGKKHVSLSDISMPDENDWRKNDEHHVFSILSQNINHNFKIYFPLFFNKKYTSILSSAINKKSPKDCLSDILNLWPNSLQYQDEKTGNTPLHFAISTNYLEAAKILLDNNNIKINLINNDRNTPLHLAVANEQSEIISLLLLRDNLELNAKNSAGMTPLYLSIVKNDLEAVRILLANNTIDPNIAKITTTPLHLAVMRGNTNIVNLLLKNKHINPNLVDNNMTPIHLATQQRNLEMVRLLLKHPLVDLKITNIIGTPLHTAALNNDTTIAKELIEHDNSIINIANYSNQLALHYAIEKKNTELVSTLIKIQGVLLDSSEKYSSSGHSFFIAANSGNLEIIKILFEKYPDMLSTEDWNLNTLLHCTHSYEIFNFLLEKKPELISKINGDSKTPLHTAISNCASIEVLTLLLSKKSDLIYQKDDKDRTALDLAIKKNRKDIIEFLRKQLDIVKPISPEGL